MVGADVQEATFGEVAGVEGGVILGSSEGGKEEGEERRGQVVKAEVQ